MKSYNKIMVCFLLGLFLLSCEKELSVSPKIEKYEYGKAYIISKPAGARIFIDGKNMEKVTPDTISWLDYGEQELVLKLDYFTDYKVNINVKKDGVQKEFFDFFDLPDVYGLLKVESNKIGANIFLNNVLIGKTPYYFNKLTPGKHKIKIENIGFITKEIEVKVFSGLNDAINVSLIDTTKIIRYSDLGYDLGAIYSSGYNSEQDLLFYSTSKGNYFLKNNNLYAFNSSNNVEKKNINNFLTSDKNISRAITNTEIFILKNGIWEEDNYLNSILDKRTLFSLDENENIICMGTDNGATIIKDGNIIEINTTNSLLTNSRITNVLISNKDYIYLFTADMDTYIYYKGFLYTWPYKIDAKRVIRMDNYRYFVIVNPLLNGPMIVNPEELHIYSYLTQTTRFNFLYFSNSINLKLNSVKMNKDGEIFVASNLGVTHISRNYSNLGQFKGYFKEVIDLHFTNNNNVILSTSSEGIIRYKE